LQGIVDWHFVLLPPSQGHQKLHYLATSAHHAYTQNLGYSQNSQRLVRSGQTSAALREVLVTAMLPDFSRLFAFVFTLDCVYLCSLLPCTFDGWVPILWFLFTWVFFLQVVISLGKC
jgi:hypothetical protein